MLPGNTVTKTKIWNDLKNNKLPHAILFSGPKGTGKYDFCKEIASKLLGTENLRPPELVLVDMLYQEGVHSDSTEIAHLSTFDQSHRKKEKKRSDSLGIEDVHAFTKHLHETVFGDWKIVIIRDIERMTIPASNTFLKILEEPPKKTLFLMTTSASSKILPTIFSRCRREHFSQVQPVEEKEFLEQHGTDIDEDEKRILLQISQGRIALLQNLIHNRDLREKIKESFLSLTSLLSKSPIEKISAAEKMAKESVSEIVHYLGLIETICSEKIKQKTEFLFFLEELDTVRQNIIGNGNKKLFLERLFLAFPKTT